MNEETKRYLDEQFAKVATKADLSGIESRVGMVEERMATKEDLVSLEGRMGETLRDLTTMIDHRFDDVEEKLDSVTNQVSGHGKRISYLEKKVL